MTNTIVLSKQLPDSAQIYNMLAEQLRTGGAHASISVDRKTYRRNASERSLLAHSRRLSQELPHTVAVSSVKIATAGGRMQYRFEARVIQ